MVQLRAARVMKHDYARTSNVTNMLTDLKWDTLKQRRINTRTTMLFRIIHNLVDIEPDPPLINARSNRGHNQRLSQIRACIAIFQNSFFPATVVFWNKLPQVIVDQTSLDAFKATNTLHIKTRCFYPFILFNSGNFIFDLSQSCLLRM